MQRDVFLGGSCGAVGDKLDWRRNIAIPELRYMRINRLEYSLTLLQQTRHLVLQPARRELVSPPHSFGGTIP